MHSGSCGQSRTQHHLAEEWELTLPWYLIPSCCHCRKSRLLVLLLRPCLTESSAVASHPRLPSIDRISSISSQPQALFSLSIFLRALLPTVIVLLSLLALWGQNLWAQAQTPKASPPCLHLQFVSSLTAQANVRLSFPPDCRNSSYTSHQWAKKKSKEKLLNNTRERRKTKSYEGLEKLAQSPALQTCNRSGAI